MSKDLGYRAVVEAGNIPEDDLPTQPGEWQIRHCTDHGEDFLEFYFGCPLRPGTLCGVSIFPKKHPNGSSWTWDGNKIAPTLGPSINCIAMKDGRPTAGCGWHGFVIAGKFQ